MKKAQLLAPAFLGLALALQGCAHNNTAEEKRIDDRASQETSVNTRSDLIVRTNQLVESATNLSPEQKTQLIALRDSSRKQADEIYDKSLKLRTVLVKDLISPNYDEKEVSLIKKKIKTLEEQRLSLFFGSVEKAKKILGHQAVAHEKIMNGLMDVHGHGI